MSDYLADVKKYHAAADEAVVKKIITHLGIALQSRDASLVASSDQAEIDRVIEKWCGKKLGVTGAEATIAVNAVSEIMKGEKNKSRVTFYYLVAKELNKLSSL